MSDTTPDPNPYRLPFTREEYVLAEAQIRPREQAERRAARLFDRSPDVIGISVMEGEIILVALVSDELAERMKRYRPSAAEIIDRCRADRDEVLRRWRESVHEEDG